MWFHLCLLFGTFLLYYLDTEQDGVDGPTSDIIEAARTNNTGLFKSLLTRTNDDFRVYNDFGDGLLETAASFGHLEILNVSSHVVKFLATVCYPVLL